LASGLHTQFQYPFTNPGAWALIGEYALGLSGCLLILVAFLGLDAGLWPRWVIYLGRISFGLYVYHELALDIISASLPHAASLTSALASVKLSLAIGLNIAMAALSYRYLEAPFLRMKKRQSIIQSTL
jgi:peptidoglycan/LPS O-acetylase OafA/YrhL